MKKLILSLLIFCSMISQAQIQIPQVVGLPSALNSKVDKVNGKSLVADSSIIKLNGIQSDAQVNILEGVQRNGANLTITGKKVNVIVPTTPSEVGAEPANTNIQSHISSTSNPHSVTKSQVGLGNVDNTSDINKPISTATQTALNGKQPAGNYSTDIHSNITALNAVSNTNTGDETLTSIKTKLGAATAVSDGYLKYQDWGIFNSKEPSFTKNTAFNKNFGTTTGTVLEGRTFGTAAGSAVGDFQPVITGLTTNYIPKWNGSFVNSPLAISNGTYGDHIGYGTTSPDYLLDLKLKDYDGDIAKIQLRYANYGFIIGGGLEQGLGSVFTLDQNENGVIANRIKIGNDGIIHIPSTITSTLPTNGALVVGGGIGADHVRANNFYGDGSNLTGIQLPITLTTNGTSGAATFNGGVLNVPNYAATGTGGTYPCPPTNVTNLTSSSIGMSIYTKTGSVYRVSISGVIDPTAAGTCVIRLPMPTNISGGVVPMCYSSSNFTTPQGWSVSAGSNYIDLSINTSGSSCQFYANITYVY